MTSNTGIQAARTAGIEKGAVSFGTALIFLAGMGFNILVRGEKERPHSKDTKHGHHNTYAMYIPKITALKQNKSRGKALD